VTQTIDANILLYASDAESPLRDKALAFVSGWADGPSIVYLFWPTVMAYLRLSTHASVFRRPLKVEEALANIGELIDRAHVRSVGEGAAFWAGFRGVAVDARPNGNLISDAHLVGLMRENGVRTIWTHDRDFRRFSGIEVRDPFD
jgi:toxin-antitoxin system PIN domain toxin